MSQASFAIAVVDDEESVRKALGRLIRAAGFAVQTYPSGGEFLRAPERPDCVVLDLRMPQMDGFAVQQALRQADPRVAVVMMTGDDAPGGRERALGQGAAAYLRKPIDDEALLGAIQTALRAGRVQ
jgi:FixJ family two-component response regulator